MIKSGLQFKNPKMEKIFFELNKEYDENEELSMDMDSEVQVKKNQDESEATIVMNLKLGFEGENAPFKIDIIASSDFRWSEDVEFDIDKTLKVSGSTMLLSYIRPVVANLTMQAGLSPFHIPFLDLTRNVD